MNTAVLFSGGVDSAVVVHLLCEQGERPDLFYIKIGMDGDEELSCTAQEDIELCQATARRYGLHLEVVDLQQEYWDRVVTYIIDRVRRGLTPNSDVMCNRLIKFGAFDEKVGHAYDRLATGHYARIIEQDGMKWLATALDPVKDQTDFMAQIESLQIPRLVLPLGEMMKSDVRRIAQEQRLPSAHRKDSQGICFLGKIDYSQFVKRFLGEREGDVIELETGRKIGRHRGYWFHTIGQRKGLGLGGGPWFVVKKDVRHNIIYVSHGYDTVMQYGNEFRLSGFHYLTADPWQGLDTTPVCFKIRHTSPLMRGIMTRQEDGLLHIHSESPIQGIAPGQFGVLYDEHALRCIGSAEIVV